MRSEKEIKEMLKKVEELLKCCRCGTVDPMVDYDGLLTCRKCYKEHGVNAPHLEGDWIDYGFWIALKWVLGEDDEHVKDYVRHHLGSTSE